MSTPAISPRPRGSSHSHTSARPRSTQPMTRPSTSLHPAGPPAALTPRMNGVAKTPSHVVSQKSKEPGMPSPNYFGLTINSAADHFSSSAAQHIRGNWSPPTSNVRSTAAASPRILPVEHNPEFEQFRKQSENNRSFALGSFDFASAGSGASAKSPFFSNFKTPLSPQSMTPPSAPSGEKHDAKEDHEAQPKPRSPKRMLSSESTLFPDRPRRNSPASFEGHGRTDAIAEFAEDRIPRPSLPTNKPPHIQLASHRAETLPANIGDETATDGPTMATAQHIVNILESAVEEVLLLDLRVSTQYAKSRIAGALSLCIPTTLLKRASFNSQKLAETFKDDEQREMFERWRSSKYIIVYDSSSSQLKDAATCINTLKKFTNEGWSGGTFIIRGGFQEFSRIFPAWIRQGSSHSPTSSATAGLRLDSGLPSVAPVIGGCPMPATQSAANPFFGNIRQNMDLIGGVGQMPVKQPADMTQSAREELPHWLQKASEEKDNGRTVSDKFLHIEKREQKRMQEALSGKVIYGTPTGLGTAKQIQIAGIEKGSKNRYNNIWPYEHSRVKIEGLTDGSCDYVNANHVQAAYSNKRYIATQGPIPATFKDFWNVVWQQDVRVIVMLTAEQEGGQVKAHNYWSDKRYGPLHLNQLGERRASLEPSKIHKRREQSRPSLGQRRSTNPSRPANFTKEATAGSPNQEQPYVIVRKFTLSNDDEPFARMREITQLQYSNWPDFGAPAHPTHLLGLIEQCDAVVRSVNGSSISQPEPANSRPIIVHCSAGCGRTGTFCTVDSVLDMLKRQRQARQERHGTPMEVDEEKTKKNKNKNEREEGSWVMDEDVDLIAKTVEDFRLQRLSMVQSLRQFVLCYESVMEWLVEQHPRSA
ncbi:tyrosine-protein phosphatase non-receptor type 6 [Cucurbitaria berberidis CBS 394.84]|uniref:protein-tyrosine-phosphatase n=1 Tax=Cucurbitaria berberidis CBS 394.84 TaxID=1168544 RepID=A0A9P4GBK4_9PLEO|nr:tyrosine-protein phosphatase non-receptor type 6 [Cucurbitaria berberidis CBS 394.84]KAF1842597.1 tyrosine-protein phosphatase non-receptor type 6 [Cucurbitaria berberidis CBS 394.84]